MTITEYLMNLVLVGLVLLQIRGHKVTAVRLLVPVALTVWAASQFLHAIPTAGNDVALEALLALAGCALGAFAGLATSVRRDGPARLRQGRGRGGGACGCSGSAPGWPSPSG